MSELDSIPPPLRAECARLIERYREAGGAPDARLAPAFAKSPFLGEYAVHAPAAFAAMIDDPATADARTSDDFRARVDAALAAASDTNQAKATLRRLRRAELVRIAWRDLELGVDVLAIMTELSAFADAVVERAVAWVQAQLAPRFGRALGEDGAPLGLLVLGMGKLGGRELNFSSDIDLLFVFESDGETVGGRKAIEHQEYFDRVGRELIGLLNENTADGFVFRVDMRLRPFGDSGPLSSSLSALEHYYAVHGRDWERYALIKARPLCGDARCRQLLDGIVRPFVFRRYLDYGALDALREMKGLIDREASSEELAGDVKRGRGGIREIEFTGQLFQLTRGGREPRLRQRSLVPTLHLCAELGLLGAEDVDKLVNAYCFLRMTEHRLQQVRDAQTHSLPRDDHERVRLAYAAGYADWDAFSAALAGARGTTSRLFGALLRPRAGADNGDEDAPASVATPWAVLWQLAASESDELETMLHQHGRARPAVLAEVLRDLRSDRFQARLSQHSRARLDRIMPQLIEMVTTRRTLDETVRRIAQLLRAIAGRSVYLAFLADNPDALARLIDLFAASIWIADEITRQPLLMDELLDPRVLFAPPNRARLFDLLGEQLAANDGDLEAAMETLRAFRSQQMLRVAASDITEQFPIAEVSNQLTYIAEACLDRGLALAWRDLVARNGEPRCIDDGRERTASVAIIGYGKLGGWELGYSSDLDLVFLHDSHGEQQQTNGPKVVENNVFFSRLAQRLIHVLSTTTPSGIAYEIDTRLRPSGGAGQLVTSVHALKHYLETDAWVWEHQALVRARAIAGDPALCARFAEVRADVLARPRDEATLKHEVATMRGRMLGELDRGGASAFDLKHGLGGITDIEFMVQYHVLRWAGTHAALLTWTDNLRLLETIAELGLLPAVQCRRLHDAYFAYRAELHRCALQQIDGLVAPDRFQDQRREVREIWDTVFA